MTCEREVLKVKLMEYYDNGSIPTWQSDHGIN